MNHKVDLFQYMHEGATVLTPNNRLSLHLIEYYEKQHRRYHSGLAEKPRCFSYEAWLQDVFWSSSQRSSQDQHPLLLSNHQQRFIWKEILQENLQRTVSDELINTIQDAWQRCIFWQISPEHPSFQYNQQSRRFQQWYRQFQQVLKRQYAITIAELPTYLSKIGFNLSNSTLVWSCFDEFTPIQRKLQQSLSGENCLQLFDDFQEKSINGYCYAAKDPQQELHQAITWAQQRLNAGDHRIAIILPELQNNIQSVQTAFSQSFSSELYNISYGKPLLDYPIINTAIHLLTLDHQSINAEQIKLLMQSPFIAGGQKEFAARSLILQDSQLMTLAQVSWQHFLTQIKTVAPKLHACLQAVPIYPKKDTVYGWVQHFKQRLYLLGFPGEIEINSHLYQCLQRFLLLFDELMSLNILTKQLSAQEAIQALRALSASVLFQIQKPPSPITVLGFLEASGCYYDSIWITSLTDNCLPQKTKFSPFLPVHLQKSMKMPHSDAQTEFQRAQVALHRFGYACHAIVYSYPSTIGEQSQFPYALIAQYPQHDTLFCPELKTTCGLESYSESYLFPPKPNEKLSGGTAMLASQAKCPFQAFASHRLKAKPGLSIRDGLDLAQRGQLLHKIMEHLWLKLDNQTNLLRLSSEQLDTIIDHCIQLSWDSLSKNYPNMISALSQEVEYQRLKYLIHRCLDWEKRRNSFQVLAIEQSHQINIAGLSLQIRMDRLDQDLVNDSQVVIDYKTSLPNSKPWLEERPESPQLLVYALLNIKMTTLMFIQLKAGNISLQGLSAHPLDEPGIQSLQEHESWTTYHQHWEKQLSLLASEIQSGNCEPKPKRSSLCQQCAFPSLCRLA